MEIKYKVFDSLQDINKWFTNKNDVKIINIETGEFGESKFTCSFKVWFFHNDSNELIDKFLYEKRG